MTNFPSSLPSIPTATTNQHLDDFATNGHVAHSNLVAGETTAIATKVGTGASTPTAGTLLRGTGTGTTAWGQVDLKHDVTGSLPVANAGLILQAVYPVGCIYTETTGVNPATTFGFGSWSQTGQGRVLVGQGTSDQAFAAGATGGESNHTLTGAESGTSVHTHLQNPHLTGSSQVFNDTQNVGTGATARNILSLTPAAGNQNLSLDSATATNQNSTAANAANSHNNLQPYQVVYFWTRTS